MVGVALASLLNQEQRARANDAIQGPAGSPPTPALPKPHYAPRAKNVIHIFAAGGVSHVDTFDYKPELVRSDGQIGRAHV